MMPDAMLETTSRQLQTTPVGVPSTSGLGIPPVPWRDPHTVSREELAGHIQRLEQACLEHPGSADLRTALGMAYAMNFDVYKSIDALEAARDLDPDHFWAQLKYSELYYRLRALIKAEQETLKAVELARNPWQLSLARKQLQEIRTLSRNSARNVAWTKPLAGPALILSAMILIMFAVMAWK
jgi:tetratricopeptide (TPR) repeat protein